MNDIDHDTDRDADHDRIDALAREAGSALRRPPSPNQLARVHRVKRNRQLARAAGGGLAVVALVAGGVALLQRDADEQLVPATVPASTVPASTVPVTVPTSTVPDTAVTTLAPATTVPPLAAAPELLYLGTNDKAAEQVQRVVDLATLEVLRTEPLDDDAWRAYSGWREPRFDSATGITYELGSYPGDDPADGLPVVDWCGRFPLEVEGAPAGTTALPDRASLISVSEDGRWLLVVGASACPVDGLIEPDMNVEQITYEQEVRLFDANDPAAPGRLLWTSPYPERQFMSVEFSDDGELMAITHVLNTFAADGVMTSQRGLDVVELSTGRGVEPTDPACTIAQYGQDDQIFVGDTAYVITKYCDDGVYVELNRRSGSGWQRTDWLLPGLGAGSFPTVEVWPPSVEAGPLVFLANATISDGSSTTGRTFLGEGSAVRELPFDDDRVSFGPLPEIVGD